MDLIDILILRPLGEYVWIPLSVAVLALVVLLVLSMLRCAVHSISESESRILHRSKNPREQMIYKFYQRKEKVKAAMATAETLWALVVIISLTSLISGNMLMPEMALFVFDAPAWPSYIAYFVLLAFVLVIVIIVPGRMMSDGSRRSMLMGMGWLVELTCALTGWVSLCNSYSNAREENSSSQLTVAIGSAPPKTGEKEMIRNILQFGDIEVSEIMTPRHDIVGVQKNVPFSVVKKTIEASNFSRLPVYEDSPDSIFGIVYVKDLLTHVSQGDDFDWTRLIRRITFVSENKKISDLLKEFQLTKNHMAAVSDEYGGISGLITMQDILEKIVGEISDEFDIDQMNMFTKVSDNYYVFNGRIMIDDFCREMGLESTYFDELKGDAESLAGLLLEIRGDFPARGERIKCRDLTFSVEAFSGRKIEKIGVMIKN